MDDGSRITIFNSDYPKGRPDMPNGVNNFVKLNERASMDLARFLRPGANRVVITLVDDCPSQNQLRSAKVFLDGAPVAPAQPATETPAVRRYWSALSFGLGHIHTTDGLNYNFQTPGDFVFFRNADATFQVQTRHAPWPATVGSVGISAAAALVEGAARVQAVLDENPSPPQVVAAIGIDPVAEIGENALEIAMGFIKTDTDLEDEPADQAAVEPAVEPTDQAAVEPAAEPADQAASESGPSFAAELFRDQQMAMNGHYLIFQQDGNLCVYRSADNGWVRCINDDPTVGFGDTARVVMTQQGQLTGLDSAGQVIYSLPPEAPGTPSDAFLTEAGALEIINDGRVLWSSN